MCGIAVRNPDKSLPKEHMVVLVNSPVAGKTLAKVGMEANFILRGIGVLQKLQDGWWQRNPLS
jgi:hypothetical protein